MYGTSTYGSPLYASWSAFLGVFEEEVDMLAFPTISTTQSKFGFVEVLSEDPTLRTNLEDGSFDTRTNSAWPNNLLKDFNVSYRYVSEEDKRTIDLFQRTSIQVGVTQFRWTHPVNNKRYAMQLKTPILFTLESNIPYTYLVGMELIGYGTYNLGQYGTNFYGA